MAYRTLPFAGATVGYIVRGKWAVGDTSKLSDETKQHADCILPNGAPVGWFGSEEIGPASGGRAGGLARYAITMAAAFSGVAKGKVFDYTDFWNDPYRRGYVDGTTAATTGPVSMVLVFRANAQQAQNFTAYWQNIRNSPIRFRIIGKNCSTVASRAFQYAGLLGKSIPALDTPERLFRQLYTDAYPISCDAGLLDFAPTGNGYTVRIDDGQ